MTWWDPAGAVVKGAEASADDAAAASSSAVWIIIDMTVA